MRTMGLSHANVKSIEAVPIKNNLRFIFSLNEEVKWKIKYLPIEKDHGARLQLVLTTIENSSQLNTKKESRQFKKLLLDSFKKGVIATYATLKKPIYPPRRQTPLPHLSMNSAPKIIFYDEPTSVPITDKKSSRFMVVIDPGHGGKDPGAHGVRGMQEKTVVLAIAKRLVAEINRDGSMQAVLTRAGDYFVSLRERLKLARKGSADLFIAIHADAYFDKNATGASVYALSKRGATSEAARWLASRENYSELGEVALNHLQDRSLMLRSVLIDLAQTMTIRDSIRLGNKLLDAIDNISSLHHAHVEQAPFVVLKSPDIPSILVETGFITNPREENRLSDPVYQQKMAKALFLGLKQYKTMNQNE